jgi:hypothetical protein
MNFCPGMLSMSRHSDGWLPDCFEAIVHDLRLLIRQAKGRNAHPSAAILDGRTLQSTPESGGHAGCDGAKRHKGSKVHAPIDTLGQLLALIVTTTFAVLMVHQWISMSSP